MLCACSKTTVIVKSFASSMQENLICKTSEEEKFILATDGSNTIEDKLFLLVVIYYGDEIKKNCYILTASALSGSEFH